MTGMGYFHRHQRRAPEFVDMSADEFLQWVAGHSAESPADGRDSAPPTPYERVMLDAQGSCARNLVVVVDDSRVIATVIETGFGALWRPVVQSTEGADHPPSSRDELLEWEGERPRPLRLVTDHGCDADPMEVESALVLSEVEVARTTKKVRRLHVRAAAAIPRAATAT